MSFVQGAAHVVIEVQAVISRMPRYFTKSVYTMGLLPRKREGLASRSGLTSGTYLVDLLDLLSEVSLVVAITQIITNSNDY